LPIGQGLEIRCRLEAEFSGTLDYWADGLWLDSREVLPGGLAAAAWQPGEVGSHVLTVALRASGPEVTRVARGVVVLPAGAPVRIP